MKDLGVWEYIIVVALFLIGGGFFGKVMPILIERRDKNKNLRKEIVGRFVSKINNIDAELVLLLEKELESCVALVELYKNHNNAQKQEIENLEELKVILESCKGDNEKNCNRCKELEIKNNQYKENETNLNVTLDWDGITKEIKNVIKHNKLKLDGEEDVYIKSLNKNKRRKLLSYIGNYEILVAKTHITGKIDDKQNFGASILELRLILATIKELILEQ